MSKKIAFKRPSKARAEVTANGDAWVDNRVPDAEEPIKRLQVEIPASLHLRVKAGAAQRGHRTMSDMVRSWLEREFPA